MTVAIIATCFVFTLRPDKNDPLSHTKSHEYYDFLFVHFRGSCYSGKAISQPEISRRANCPTLETQSSEDGDCSISPTIAEPTTAASA